MRVFLTCTEGSIETGVGASIDCDSTSNIEDSHAEGVLHSVLHTNSEVVELQSLLGKNLVLLEVLRPLIMSEQQSPVLGEEDGHFVLTETGLE